MSMQRIAALRQLGTPRGWIELLAGRAGRYVSHGTFAGSDADAGSANARAATSTPTAKAPLPMRE
jgi:hypothetical protein